MPLTKPPVNTESALGMHANQTYISVYRRFGRVQSVIVVGNNGQPGMPPGLVPTNASALSECAVKKAMVLSGREKSRPGTGSFHPVAIEAAAEATKLLKPSV